MISTGAPSGRKRVRLHVRSQEQLHGVSEDFKERERGKHETGCVHVPHGGELGDDRTLLQIHVTCSRTVIAFLPPLPSTNPFSCNLFLGSRVLSRVFLDSAADQAVVEKIRIVLRKMVFSRKDHHNDDR